MLQERFPREVLAMAATAGGLALLLVWLGPPGSDMAAHVYQRWVFVEHGFSLWNNLWYSGRYSFVTYTLVYYPLAAVFGIRLLAVATIAVATLAFAGLVSRQWGPLGRWSSWTFAVVWAAVALSAAFPFLLGVAFALLALQALQAGCRWRFGALVALTVAASPVAFLLLAVVLASLALGRPEARSNVVAPATVILLAAAAELLLWRMFATGGRYPFSIAEFLAACVFCVIGTAVTWRTELARPIRLLFPVYLVVCAAAFAVPSGLGENVGRLRFAALPLAVLIASLRRWRPLWMVLTVIALACSWNVTPLIASFEKGRHDPAAARSYWQPAIGFLRTHLTPSYRAEVVDTVGHWEALYLPQAGIPLARGWFRQDDFPTNEVLYDGTDARGYVGWLRRLGVRYVVLTDAPPDYSARREAALLASGRSGLETVARTGTTTVFAVPKPVSIVTGPGRPRVTLLRQAAIDLLLTRPGNYRVAVRYAPFWKTQAGCLTRRSDGMMTLTARRAGHVVLRFDVDVRRAWQTLRGHAATTCSRGRA
jgi:hypothetical protein